MAKNFDAGKLLSSNAFWYVVGGVLAYSYVIRPITDALHITKSSAAEANDNAPVTQNAWSATFWKTGGPDTLIIKAADAEKFCQTIYSFPSLFSDNWNSVLGVFQSLKTKSEVSYLAYYFNNKYQTSLYGFLQDGGGLLPWDGLSQDHLTILNNYVNKLPAYKV